MALAAAAGETATTSAAVAEAPILGLRLTRCLLCTASGGRGSVGSGAATELSTNVAAKDGASGGKRVLGIACPVIDTAPWFSTNST